MISIKRALLSCWDKTGLDALASALVRHGVEIVSSGGTADHLSANGMTVTKVEDVTGYPAVLNGRVKTLHPLIHAPILAKRSKSHLRDLEKMDAKPIDLVVVNLYPFVEEAVAKQLPLENAIEFIDIGGPTLLRAAAKNHAFVVALHRPDQYHGFMRQLAENNGKIAREFSRRCAREIFFYTAWYDGQIQAYLSRQNGETAVLPEQQAYFLRKKSELRYGENPHQAAAVYHQPGRAERGLAAAEVLWGKPLSFNNYVDVHAAYELALDLPDIGCAIIKHTNPCGAASCETSAADAFEKALRGDSMSAFGGIVACNRAIDAAAAEQMHKIFFECIIAPDFDEPALKILKTKKNLRLLKMEPGKFFGDGRDVKFLNDTVLIQQANNSVEDPRNWQVVTEKQPDSRETAELSFAWKIVKHVKSNAIVLIRDREIYGVGAGQMSRIDSVRIAREKALNAGRELKNLVMASDAFFPFRDGIDAAVEAGVTAIVQPGGSIRDKEVIDAANEHGLSMIFTGIRHFKH